MQNHPDLIPPSVRHQTSNKKNNLLGISLSLLLALGAFFTGFQMNNILSAEGQSASIFSIFAVEAKPTIDSDTIDLSEFWKVWQLLDEKFTAASTTQTISDQDKINGAIKGMVKTYGDPYTVYLPPKESQDFAENIAGNFSGIGMEVGIRNNVVTVISPLPDTPAERAGLLAGDLITKIDDSSTEGMSIDEAVHLIRGEKGTEVKLSIYREGELEIKEFTIVRDTITIPTVKTEEKDGVFTIRIYSFNAVAESKTQEALREFATSDAKSLILDLRGNPGGYLQSAVAIASYFLPTGKVVVREHFSETDEDRPYRSQGRTFYDFNPKNFVVLVDGGSASASEILAGALKEHKVATVIGTNTFGKGSVQELLNLDSGASLKVTVARWLTPEGKSISDGGLEPDIHISRTPQQIMDNVDPQFDAAIDFLEGKEIHSEEN
ncbi:MAG: S41 family peptidase [Candidatus Nomurabacteria bacterium]|nr:MAG: S41 family peptidase [Candidatus Nomurabacteria bacterium]